MVGIPGPGWAPPFTGAIMFQTLTETDEDLQTDPYIFSNFNTSHSSFHS